MGIGPGALEGGMGLTPAFWQGRRVFLTGHTGFKGGWLSLWLARLGAEVHGLALAPPTDPSFCVACDVPGHVRSSTLADVADAAALLDAMARARPQVVLHLAAQPLVRASYAAPLETYRTNVMGTANLLEAVRRIEGVEAVVVVTTDKCYENREWVWPYREHEPMGGHDPYSSSKGCAELVTAAYRRSFLAPAGVHVATARAGNVIGGGDWAADRLVPDLLRAADAAVSAPIRSPRAVRPWQHVLEPLAGYLMLAEQLVGRGAPVADAWNFGPAEDDARPVEWIARRLASRVPGMAWHVTEGPQPHEAHTLRLDSSKARADLGWRPRWSLETAIDRTASWHLAWREGRDVVAASLDQIAEYEGLADS